MVDKSALITGATCGLGQAIAKKLLRDGWKLILVGRDPHKLKAVYADKHVQIIRDCSNPDLPIV